MEPRARWRLIDFDDIKDHARDLHDGRGRMTWSDLKHYGAVIDLFKPATSPAARVLREQGV